MLGVVVDVARVVVPKLEPRTAHEADFASPCEPAYRQPLDPTQSEAGLEADVEVGSVRGRSPLGSYLLDGWSWTPGTLPHGSGSSRPGGLKHVELVAPPTFER